jgi:hypothetical protein
MERAFLLVRKPSFPTTYSAFRPGAVIELAVLSERLAMVGCHDNDDAIEQATLVERVEQARDPRIGVGKFGDVWIVSRRERLGRFVRTVRIVQVRPQEERRVPRLCEPHRVCRGHNGNVRLVSRWIAPGLDARPKYRRRRRTRPARRASVIRREPRPVNR